MSEIDCNSSLKKKLNCKINFSDNKVSFIILINAPENM